MNFIKSWFSNEKETDPSVKNLIPNTGVIAFNESNINADNAKDGKRENEKSEWAASMDEEDRVEKAIRESGCWPNHLEVVGCMQERGDWRLCQDSLQGFKMCMTKKSVENAARMPKKNAIEAH